MSKQLVKQLNGPATLFVFGDVHGCLKELKESLSKAGYNENNPHHVLVSLGDNFDRGGLARGVYEFLRYNDAICLRGNHEGILEGVFRRGELNYTDLRNGLAETIASFAKCSKTEAVYDYEAPIKAAKYPGLVKWMHDMPWALETKKYVFVHGWLPENVYNDEKNRLEDADFMDWYHASWSKTPAMIDLHRSGAPCSVKKCIVFGHWHTWRLKEHDLLEKERPEVLGPEDFGLYVDEKYHLIGVDACTNYSGQVNVLVLDEDLTDAVYYYADAEESIKRDLY